MLKQKHNLLNNYYLCNKLKCNMDNLTKVYNGLLLLNIHYVISILIFFFFCCLYLKMIILVVVIYKNGGLNIAVIT